MPLAAGPELRRALALEEQISADRLTTREVPEHLQEVAHTLRTMASRAYPRPESTVCARFGDTPGSW